MVALMSKQFKKIDDIFAAASPQAISDATQKSRKPVTADAVRRWRKNGIPHEHWDVLEKRFAIPLEAIRSIDRTIRRRLPPARPSVAASAA
jgi:hypothetical protein